MHNPIIAQKKVKLKKDGTPSRQGEGGGKPPAFASAEELQIAVDAYFREKSQTKMPVHHAGLAVHLGVLIETMDQWQNGERGEQIAQAIKSAKQRIHAYWLDLLGKGANSVAGAIFYLKNVFAYKDKQDIDMTSGGEHIQGFRYVVPTLKSPIETGAESMRELTASEVVV